MQRIKRQRQKKYFVRHIIIGLLKKRNPKWIQDLHLKMSFAMNIPETNNAGLLSRFQRWLLVPLFQEVRNSIPKNSKERCRMKLLFLQRKIMNDASRN